MSKLHHYGVESLRPYHDTTSRRTRFRPPNHIETLEGTDNFLPDMTEQMQIIQNSNMAIPAQGRQKELSCHASPDPQHRH